MRLKEKNNSRVSVQLEKHQPERRRGFGGYLFCNGGCCCCCCCLHSLGGLIGAAAASRKSQSPSAGPVAGFYWVCFALLAVAMVVLFSMSAQASEVSFFIIGALTLLPLVQLLASILTLIWIKSRRAAFSDQKASLQVLGKITLYSFLGTLTGGIAMIVGFQMFK